MPTHISPYTCQYPLLTLVPVTVATYKHTLKCGDMTTIPSFLLFLQFGDNSSPIHDVWGTASTTRALKARSWWLVWLMLTVSWVLSWSCWLEPILGFSLWPGLPQGLAAGFPPRVNVPRGVRMEASSPLHPGSEVTWCCFWCVLFITSKFLKPTFEGRRIMFHLLTGRSVRDFAVMF